MDRDEQRVRFLGLLRPIARDLENYSRRMVFDRRDCEDALQNEELEEFAGLDFATEAPISWETLADALDEELLVALQSLNDSERAVLLMRAIGDLRYREISECLGVPLGSVMGNLSRARQKMRDAILRARRRSLL